MIWAKVPRWRDALKGGEARRLWLRHWFRNFPLDLLQWALHYIFSVLPIDLVSGIGGTLARVIIPSTEPGVISRTLTNLRRLQPAWSEEQRREVMFRHFENVGRVHAEFSILHRLLRAGRVQVENIELALKAVEEGPVVFVGMHTGNWEIFGCLAGYHGIPGFFVYEPQISPMQNYLLLKSRLRIAAPGSVTLGPGPGAALEAFRTLKAGKPIVIFCDEPSGDRLSRAPFFGRATHLESNYSVAVRLARRVKAPIIPFYCVRHNGCRFTVKFGPLMSVSGHDDAKAALLEDVVRLNDLVESVTVAHLDQWYWLAWGVAGVAYE